jgi:hypothetical protein
MNEPADGTGSGTPRRPQPGAGVGLLTMLRRPFAGLGGVGGALVILVALAGGALASESESDAVVPVVPRSLDREVVAGAPEFFKICRDQTYALCAAASCFVFDQVAYCKCDIEHGDSISLPFEFDGQDVCSVNADGPTNGVMVRTFRLPDSVLEGGNKALYTCRSGTADGSYAQCDGGLCFTSTEASPSFPGFDEPLAPSEIICSCPITTADPDQATFGYQIAGPFPWEDSFFENCSSVTTNRRTGSTIPVGAPTGVPRLLTRLLDGEVPPLNVCPAPAGDDTGAPALPRT